MNLSNLQWIDYTSLVFAGLLIVSTVYYFAKNFSYSHKK